VNEGMATILPSPSPRYRICCGASSSRGRGHDPDSPPDKNGYMSLGVSVDITKAAVENASKIIVQVNSSMPRVHGETFLNIKDVDFIIPHEEPLLVFEEVVSDEMLRKSERT